VSTSWLPRGVSLTDEVFAQRHRVIWLLLVAHVPVLIVLALVRHRDGMMVWGQLGVLIALAATAQIAQTQTVRASATALGLMFGADILVHIGGGLTDLHIWFYVVLVAVALYQTWIPFILAVAFVAIHHAAMAIWMPDSVFSTPEAQHHPYPFVALHAAFLLAEAMFLAYGWKFTEAAENERQAEAARAGRQAAEQAQTQQDLALERARSAEAASSALADREEQTKRLATQMVQLESAGGRMKSDAAVAASVMESLGAAIADISAAAARASTTAQDAADRSRKSAGTVERLSNTMTEVTKIAATISGIAEQTNLLALNATIESARAGDAGKGFAVVAGEVKELAQETGRATEQIQSVLDAVRADVSATAAALNSIQEVIGEVVDSQATIAAAVEEQSAASADVQQAITGAAREAEHIADGLRSVATA
jgi:hypothetical protein